MHSLARHMLDLEFKYGTARGVLTDIALGHLLGRKILVAQEPELSFFLGIVGDLSEPAEDYDAVEKVRPAVIGKLTLVEYAK